MTSLYLINGSKINLDAQYICLCQKYNVADVCANNR